MIDAIILALHALGCLGFVLVVSYSRIAAPIRARIWPAMLGCPQCFGVWAGAGWAAALSLRPYLPPWTAALHDAVAFAFAVSMLGYLFATLSSVGAAATKYSRDE